MEKIEGILKFPIPNDKTKLQSWIGSVSFYRDFVEDLAITLAPLYAKTGKLYDNCTDFVLNEKEIAAFEAVKKLMVDLVLWMPDLNKEFVVCTDASREGLGAVLMQEDSEFLATHPQAKHGLKPISFISRITHGAEKNYSTTELECLAIVYAIRKFRPYLEFTKFKVMTDHLALKWLMSI